MAKRQHPHCCCFNGGDRRGVSPADFPPGSSLASGNLWDLQKMLTKVTGRNAFLYYSSYGCYCGLGGRGRPKDATDR